MLYLTNFIEDLTSLTLRFTPRIQKAFTWQNFVTFKSLQLNNKYKTHIKVKYIMIHRLNVLHPSDTAKWTTGIQENK